MENNTKQNRYTLKTPPLGGWGASLIAFVHKEFLHVFRDKRTLLIMFGLPIVQILIFGFALTNEVKNARLLVVNPNNEAQSEQLIQKIEASSYFTIKHIEPNTQNIEKYFKNGEVQAALILPGKFSAPRNEPAEIQIVTDASDPNFAKIAINYLSAIIMDFLNKPNSVQIASMQIQTETRMLFNPSLNGSMNFVPGVIALIMMIVSTTLTSVSIVREKEFGMMEVLLVSPVRPIFVLISKMLPYLILSFANLILILLMSHYVLLVPINGNILLILFVGILYILTCLALGLLISNITSSQAFAMMFSMAGIMLPTLLFTGFLFPLENMPIGFQWFSNIVPSKWFFLIFQSVMLKGLGFADVWKEMSILFFMMIFLTVISLKKFNTRLQ